MFWFLYNILFAIGYTLMLPKFILRMCRRGGYAKGFMQRFGVYSRHLRSRIGEGRIWIHAVSVGEVYVALAFLEEMRRQDKAARYVLSTTTSTAHKIALTKLDPDDVLIYFPVDFPWAIRRVLRIVKPSSIILTECELWPNFIRLASRSNVPVSMINGIISDGSYKGYHSLRWVFGPILKCMSLCLVQSQSDADKLIKIGADPAHVQVMGSAKYDVAEGASASPAEARKLLSACGVDEQGLVLLGGSTWPGEEDALMDIFKSLKECYKDLKLVLVPRHAERRKEVEGEILRNGLSFRKRSDLKGEVIEKRDVDVLLVDVTGELMNFYACASLVFVGKSLTVHDGQNIIEPASLGKPVVVGPYMEKFPVVTSDFLEANAIVQVASKKELQDAIVLFLEDKDMRDQYGKRAAEVVKSHLGVIAKSVELIRGKAGS
jgi:3-deoxy-D-manno-octulosonic-acid transferase